MPVNVDLYTPNTLKYVFWALRNGVYPYGTTGALSDGDDAGMALYPVFATITPPQGDRTVTPIVGSGGVSGSTSGFSQDALTGALVVNAYNNIFDAAANIKVIHTNGDYNIIGSNQSKLQYAKLAFISNQKATNQESGGSKEKEWKVTEWFSMEAHPLAQDIDGTSDAVQPKNYSTSYDEVATDLMGEIITVVKYGYCTLYKYEYYSPYPVTIHTFIGDNSTVEVTLDYTIAASTAEAVQANTDGTPLVYTTAYAATGTTFTYVAAPAAATENTIRYQFLGGC